MNRAGGIATLLTALLTGLVAGCAAVDEIQVPRAERARADADITTGVKAALGADPGLRGADIGVVTSEGVVQLSGFVSSADDVAAAAAVARTVKGVTSIRNDLRLR